MSLHPRLCLSAALLSATLAVAAEEAAPPAVPLENLGLVYQNDDNPVVQEAWLLGRYHGQWHWADGSNGEDDGYEDRRYRMGGQARM